MTQAIQQGFPNISSQLVGSNGIIQQAWYQLLIALWNRTGGAIGNQTFITGDIKTSASAATQEGWLVCDGSAVSRTKYQDLFNAVQETWGAGDGSTTFNLPDFKDKFLRGSGIESVGTTGGAPTVTLGIPNLPPHNHPIIDPGHAHAITDPGHIHAITDPQHSHSYATYASDAVAGAGANTVADNSVGGTTDPASTGISINNHTTGVTINTNTTGITTGNTGGGQSFSIIPPYAVVTYLIKT